MTKLKPLILVDPIHTDPITGGPIFRDKDGKETTIPTDAKNFFDTDEAKKATANDPIPWELRPLDDYWPSKKATSTGSREPIQACLILEANPPHVLVDAEQCDELYTLFHGKGVACDLKHGAVGEPVRITFERPDSATKRTISSIFVEWEQRER